MRFLNTQVAFAILVTLFIGSAFASDPGDRIDAAQDKYNAQVQNIEQLEETVLHNLGEQGKSIDEAEAGWEEMAAQRLKMERTELGAAVKSGKLSEAKATEILGDDYHALLDAARLVETELKAHHIVSQDHTMPNPAAAAAARSDQQTTTTSTTSTTRRTAPPSSSSPLSKLASSVADMSEYSADVKRIAERQVRAMEEYIGHGGMTLDEAKAAWGKAVVTYLSNEEHMLQRLVLEHKLTMEEAEKQLQADFAAAKEAAQLVDSNLAARTQGLKQAEAPVDAAATASTTTATTTTAATTTAVSGGLRGKSTATTTATATDTDATDATDAAVKAATAATVTKMASARASASALSVPSPSSPSSLSPSSSSSSRQDYSLGAGPIVGIIAAVALVGIALVGIAVAHRNHQQQRNQEVLAVVMQGSGSSGGGGGGSANGLNTPTGSPTSSAAVSKTSFVVMV